MKAYTMHQKQIQKKKNQRKKKTCTTESRAIPFLLCAAFIQFNPSFIRDFKRIEHATEQKGGQVKNVTHKDNNSISLANWIAD